MPLDLEPIARTPLGHFPTPLERLDRLSAFLGGPEIWIKRDDCTGLAFGGNKTRKLEYLVADAQAQSADVMITFGAVQSNHVRQTVAACAKADMECHAILADIVPSSDPAYRQSGNLLLDHMSTAHLHVIPPGGDAKAKLTEILADLEAQSKSPYIVPAGGSSTVGAMAYVLAAFELRQQSAERGLSFNAILHASATGGTQVGLTVGQNNIDTKTKVWGVNVYDVDEAAFETKLQSLAADAADAWKLERTPVLNIIHGYVGDGYGLPTDAMREAVLKTFQLEGILLDPVYTGKAMSALFDLCRKGQYTATDKILFVHTGGAPGLFAYQDTFQSQPPPR